MSSSNRVSTELNWLARRRVWPCLFGLRCGRIVTTVNDPNPLPPGCEVVAEYVCQGCGTTYIGNGWRRHRVRG